MVVGCPFVVVIVESLNCLLQHCVGLCWVVLDPVGLGQGGRDHEQRAA
jgi:hypothetical protein